jgi:hypothetical protein
MLKGLFERAASGLPLASSPAVPRAPHRVHRSAEPAEDYAAAARRSEGRSAH